MRSEAGRRDRGAGGATEPNACPLIKRNQPMRHPISLALLLVTTPTFAQPDAPVLLKPDRVFDGAAGEPHAGWVVLVKGGKIAAAGPADKVEVPKGAKVVELPGTTLLPGLIDAHSHLLL